MGGLYALGGLVIALAVFLVVIYNGLVQLRQRVQNAWAQVDVQLKRRYDLIPTWSIPSRVMPNTSGRPWRR